MSECKRRPGLYERLVDGSVSSLIETLADALHADMQSVDIEDYPALAAHHIGLKVKAALTQADAEKRVSIANEILRVLPGNENEHVLNCSPDVLLSTYEAAPATRAATHITE